MSSEQPPEENPGPNGRVVPVTTAVLLMLVVLAFFFLPPMQGLRDELGGIGGAHSRPTTAGHPPTHKPTPGGGGGNASPVPYTTPPPVTAGLKAPIAGLLDRKGAPSSAYYSVIDAYVVNVNWASLQPTAGGPIVSGNAIDQAIAQVRRANAAGAHLSLKLRVFAGSGAPNWAKNLGGAPFTARDPFSGASGTVGRFWTAAFGAAYVDLQKKLAAKYDTVAEVREVTMSRCTTIYMEPFIRQITDAVSVANILAAGYSVAADQSCQQQQVLAHTVWRHTRSDLSFNPFQEILPGAKVLLDEKFTEAMMSYCRQQLGARCILENNSLRSSAMGSSYDQMYGAIRTRGPNISFQTAQMTHVGSLTGTLSRAISYGAASVELPAGYQSMGAATFASFRAQLAANARI